MKNKKDKIIALLLVAVAIISVMMSSFTAFAEECEEIPDNVMRLHILANSDSENDQDLKYRLRDYIMDYMNDALSDSASLESSERILKERLNEITQECNAFIKSRGYEYDVQTEVCEMYFTTRVYENITMPAGDYKALRIIIGEGKGQNWWCVIFPPLCLPACTEKKDGDLYFSKETSKSIEKSDGKTEYKFAVYEWLSKMFSKK